MSYHVPITHQQSSTRGQSCHMPASPYVPFPNLWDYFEANPRHTISSGNISVCIFRRWGLSFLSVTSKFSYQQFHYWTKAVSQEVKNKGVGALHRLNLIHASSWCLCSMSNPGYFFCDEIISASKTCFFGQDGGTRILPLWLSHDGPPWFPDKL